MTVKLSKEEKRRKKQFPLDNKLNCIIYLNKILTSGFLVMDKLKRYLNEEKEILEKNVKQEPIAWNIYCEQADKVGNCITFLANILGDAQGSSISYFKYRQNVKKRIADGTLHIPFYELTDTENQYLKEMNLFRNNYNHIPESILSSEVDLVKADNKACITANPLIYYIGKTVTQEVFEGLCEGHMDFKHRCNKLFQAVKKEYELLIGQPVNYYKYVVEEPQGIERAEAQMRSMMIQGMLSEEEYLKEFEHPETKGELILDYRKDLTPIRITKG